MKKLLILSSLFIAILFINSCKENATTTKVTTEAEAAPVKAAKAPTAAKVATGKEGSVKISAPMPGTILGVNVKPGDQVKKGDTLLILEAMKMENEIAAPEDGVVASINVENGASVESGQLLASMN